MSKTIFHSESGNTEQWLEVNDDRTVTYHVENSGWRMSRRGLEKGDAIMTAEEAKNRWASYATDIDQALAEIDAAQGRDSD